MLDFSTAFAKLISAVPQPVLESAPLDQSLGRVLADEVYADQDIPPFHKSFVDGYALRAQDVSSAPMVLRTVGLQEAGLIREDLQVSSGEAIRIMTGAAMPPGADAVQMVEKTRSLPSGEVEILEPVAAGSNVAPRGSEVVHGQLVLEPGRVLGPAELAVLATFGKAKVTAFRPLAASVYTTGNELVSVESAVKPGQIRNSNATMLAAQCRRMGIETQVMPTVPDNPEAVRAALRQGLGRSDALIFSGGVSAGEFDFVHQVLADVGLEILFHKAAVKPGKPLLVAKSMREPKLVFGLPGNPVSSFVTFELFVRPALRKWMGLRQLELMRVKSRIAAAVRQRPGRLFFKPAKTRFREGRFSSQPIETKGSADITGFSAADSLIVVPAEVSQLQAESEVDVILLPDHVDRLGA